jgi:hypothetical protein
MEGRESGSPSGPGALLEWLSATLSRRRGACHFCKSGSQVTASLRWWGYEDSTLKWGLSRIVKKDSGFLHEQHRDRPHIFATTSCGCEAPAKWRLDGPLVLHAANV